MWGRSTKQRRSAQRRRAKERLKSIVMSELRRLMHHISPALRDIWNADRARMAILRREK